MRKIAILLIASLAIAGCNSTPKTTERSKSLADIAVTAVVMKQSMAQDNEIKPEERWKFIAFSVSEQMRALGFSNEQIERFAKDIIDNDSYPSLKQEILAVRERYKFVSANNY
jgi:starvation-inducible outer membrane lipoprotein